MKTVASLSSILQKLRAAYGPRPWKSWGKPVDVLVDTILSQNTSAANSDAGYKRLRRRFRSWNQVANAPTEEVARCIRISGLSNIKAPRIQNILRQIRERAGKIDLSFLLDMPPRDAYDYLLGLNGIGPKTAACVLLFSFGMKLFPVDTHILRIAKRLKLIPQNTSMENASALLSPLIAKDDVYETHVLLIAHGRQTCRAANPACEWCCLNDVCPSRLVKSDPAQDSPKSGLQA